jgi:hypothetical protein
MRHVALVAFLLVLVAAAAWAVDPPRETAAPPEDEPAFPAEEPAFPEEAPQPATVPPPAPGGTAAPVPGGTPAPAAAKPEADDEVLPPLPPGERNVGPTKQRFDPSEKVRADFPVSFPVDI